MSVFICQYSTVHPINCYYSEDVMRNQPYGLHAYCCCIKIRTNIMSADVRKNRAGCIYANTPPLCSKDALVQAHEHSKMLTRMTSTTWRLIALTLHCGFKTSTIPSSLCLAQYTAGSLGYAKRHARLQTVLRTDGWGIMPREKSDALCLHRKARVWQNQRGTRRIVSRGGRRG